GPGRLGAGDPARDPRRAGGVHRQPRRGAGRPRRDQHDRPCPRRRGGGRFDPCLPALYRPGDHGADVVGHSATQYLCGHGTTLAGLIVDTGRFDPRRCPERWTRLTEPNGRFGITFAAEYERGGSGLLAYARAKYVTDLGATLPAPSAQQVLIGIETLDLRMQRISE